MKNLWKAFLLSGAFLGTSLSVESSKKVDFSKDIRPILSDRCFHCHGPDAHDRKGKLRLDVPHGPDGAFRENKGSISIKPKDLEKSELWYRIITDDEDDVMPPLDSHKEPLSDKEKELVKNWILQGANWESHWSFSKPNQNKLPAVKKKAWAKNEVDHFVLSKLEKSGLEPQQEAKKHELIRRVSLDLTGLPPSPNEVNQFINDKRENSYEIMLNKYFDSPHYGERMAQSWMDISRYGDTSVYHADGPRTMWPWRDWVIDSYNNNLPFNEFTKLQIAGDYYKNPKADPEEFATAFLRNNGTTDEGGAFDEEYRVEYVVDRLSTVSQVWLGLTMECAQCHDHKYDPISQKEFFQMYAFFNASSDKGMQTRRGNAVPTVPAKLTMEESQRKSFLQSQKEKHQKSMDDFKKNHPTKVTEWIQKNQKNKALAENLKHYFPLDEAGGKGIKDPIHLSTIGKLEGKFLKTNSRDKHKGIRLDGKTNFKFGQVGEFIDNNTPFSYGVWVKVNDPSGFQVPFAKMDSKNSYRGFDLFHSGGKFGMHLINTWPSNCIKVQSKEKFPTKQWVHLFVTYDGSNKAEGVKLYLNAKEVEITVNNNNLSQTTKSKIPFRIGKREVGHPYKNELDDIRIYSKTLTAKEVKAVMNFNSIDTLLAAHKINSKVGVKTIENHYFNSVDKDYIKIKNNFNNQVNAIKTLDSKNVMVMRDLPSMRKTYVLDRGQYDSPKKDEEIFMGTPSIFPPMKEDYPKNRLGLAQWILDPQNPLTSRVTVNRYWSMLFGEGLVKSVTDFGSQGTWPSHPKLLDWLAVEFVKKNWNVKGILKKIMMSATYRQSSVASKLSFGKDPANTLLSRGARFRLQGDFIRDLALKASGLWLNKIGGEGVKPYQPAGLWREVALGAKGIQFVQDKGDKNYRRSLYTYWKRSAPPPNMRTFDAPTREKCVIKRARTNTPLQALVTLNDPQFTEASRAFAERIIKEGGKTIESKIDYAYTWVTSHKPTDELRQKIVALYKDQLEVFKSNPEKTKDYLSVGSIENDEALNPAAQAAWAIISSLLFNLDETLTKG